VAQVVIGKAGEIVMPLIISASAFGAINGSILTGGKIYRERLLFPVARCHLLWTGRFIFAAARDGLFPFPKYGSHILSSANLLS
jgi:hypothetical protein